MKPAKSSMISRASARRTMLLNARKVFYEKGSHSTILLGIEDITDKRILENEKG